jgi:hypothetical protein
MTGEGWLAFGLVGCSLAMTIAALKLTGLHFAVRLALTATAIALLAAVVSLRP